MPNKVILQDVVELISDVGVFVIVGYAWVGRYHGILSSNIHGVVDLPIHISHFPGRVKETLEQHTHTLTSSLPTTTLGYQTTIQYHIGKVNTLPLFTFQRSVFFLVPFCGHI